MDATSDVDESNQDLVLQDKHKSENFSQEDTMQIDVEENEENFDSTNSAQEKSGSSEKVRRAEAKSMPLPKRPKTAYFHYMGDVRDEVKNENPSASVGEISKIIGEKWQNLALTERKKYENLANYERSTYKAKIKELQGLGLDINQKKPIAEIKDTELAIPLAKIKRLMRYDPEVKVISKGASILVAKATELFLLSLGKSALKLETSSAKKKTLSQLSLHRAIYEGSEAFDFLMYDFIKPSVLEQQIRVNKKAAGNGTDKQLELAKNPITSFFTGSGKSEAIEN